jgi:hypothetical protein
MVFQGLPLLSRDYTREKVDLSKSHSISPSALPRYRSDR